MTAKERIEELIRGSFPPGLTRSVIWDAIESVIKEAKAPLHVERNAAVTEEREACAKIADNLGIGTYDGSDSDHAAMSTASDIADAIRQRGQS